MARTFLAISAALPAICILSAQPPAPPNPAAPKQPVPNAGRVTLAVVNSVTKAPVNRATVRLMTPPYQTATSDAAGRVEFKDVPPGAHRLSLQAPGYVTQEFNGPMVTVAANQLTDYGNLLFTPLAVISGVVLDENDEPVPGVSVSLGRFSISWGDKYLESRSRDRATTDDRGRYRIPNIDPGSYVLRGAPPVTTEATGFAPVYYPASPTARDALRIQVNPSDNLRDFRLRKWPLFHIRGTLAGRPDGTSAQTYVTILSCPESRDAISAHMSSARIGSDGSFDAAGIPPGTYCLTSRITEASAAVRVADGDAILFAQGVVTVGEKDVEGIKLVMEPTTRVSGVIEGNKGACPDCPSLPSIRIRATGDRGNPNSGQISLTTNVFTTRLPAGEYEVQVSGGKGYLKTLKLGDQVVPDHKIRLVGESATLTLQLDQGKGRIAGSVDLGTERPGQIGLSLLPLDPGKEKRRDLAGSAITFDDVKGFSFSEIVPGTYKVYAWPFESPFSGARELTNEVLKQLPGVTVTVKDGETASIQVKLTTRLQLLDAMARFGDVP